MTTMFGKPLDYWLELDANRSADESQLILENAALRAKVSFYEHKLDMMQSFRRSVEKRLEKEDE